MNTAHLCNKSLLRACLVCCFPIVLHSSILMALKAIDIDGPHGWIFWTPVLALQRLWSFCSSIWLRREMRIDLSFVPQVFFFAPCRVSHMPRPAMRAKVVRCHRIFNAGARIRLFLAPPAGRVARQTSRRDVEWKTHGPSLHLFSLDLILFYRSNPIVNPNKLIDECLSLYLYYIYIYTHVN